MARQLERVGQHAEQPFYFSVLCIEVGTRSLSRPPWVPTDVMSSHPYRLSESAQPYLVTALS